MLPLVLQEIVENIKTQYHTLPDVRWVTTNPTEEDMLILKREAMTESKFDKVNFRKEMWEVLQKGSAELLCRQCKYGKVLVIRMKGEDLKISWSLWGRILQGFDVKARICWFAHPQKRELPGKGIAVAAEHVNGGYTFPCRTDAVVIYRLEEATRVLIHELLHASCTDNHELAIELTEAKTETYAELFLVGYASRGSMKLAEKLWSQQSNWIQELNTTLAANHGVRTLADYSARYTVARAEELKSLGISLPSSSTNRTTSSRFTTKKLDKFLT
jgi:hypothetical protein